MAWVRLRHELAARWLREDLTAARVGRKLSQDRVADLLGIVKRTVGRYESGASLPTFDVLTEMCKLYDLDNASLAALLMLARQAGWWSEYAHILNATYAEHCELEETATHIDVCSQGIVPGFLQTKDYARYIQSQFSDYTHAEELNQYVDLRMARHARLVDKRNVQIRVVLDEGIFYKNAGHLEVAQTQWLSLLHANDREHVQVRVLEFKASAPALGTCALLVAPWRSVFCSEIRIHETHYHDVPHLVRRFESWFNAAWEESTQLERYDYRRLAYEHA